MSKAKEIAAGITYQQLISNNYRPIYIGIFLAVLACLTIRNVLLRIYSKFCKTNNTTTPTSIESISNSTSTKSSIIRVTDHWLQIRLEKAGGFSPIELLISFSVVLVNATLCLIIDNKIDGPNSVYLNAPRAVALRCASMAVAQMPIVFSLTGRNSVVELLTGISYQQLRFSHKLFGYLFVFLILIHFLGILLATLSFEGMAGIASLYSIPIARWGILGFLCLLILSNFSWGFVRKQQYELFLLTHVSAATILIVSIYYHNAYLTDYYYATIAIYAFERLFRLIRLTTSQHRISPYLLSFRKPFITCTATLVLDAIVIRVPVADNVKWKSGQHCYLSFWSWETFSIGSIGFQNHPFSVMNLPYDSSTSTSTSNSINLEDGKIIERSGNKNEMIFVLKVRNGMTLTLSKFLEKKGGEINLLISVEGPYGRSEKNKECDDVLLIAGGSGIAHILSKLAQVIKDCEEDQEIKRSLKLVWVFQYIDQSKWISPVLAALLEKVSTLGNLSLSINYYITQGPSSGPISTSSSMTQIGKNLAASSSKDTTNEDKITNEKLVVGVLPSLDDENVRSITIIKERPDLVDIINDYAEGMMGKGLIVGCGPGTIIKVIKDQVSLVIRDCDIKLEIASYEC